MMETETAITPDLIPSTSPDSTQTGSPPTRQPKFMTKVSQLFNRRLPQTDERLATFDDQGIQTATEVPEQQQQQHYRRRRTKSGSSIADSAISKIDSMFSVESRVSSEHPDMTALSVENKLGSRTVHIGAINKGAGTTSQQSDRDLNEAFEKLMKEYALPPNLRPSLEHLTREQKSTLLRSSQLARSKSNLSSLTAPFATLRKSKQLLLPGTVRDPQGRHHVPRRRATHAYATHARAPQGVSGHLLSGRAKSPRYFADLLMHSTCRDLELAEIMDLRVYLRNGIASWTTEFLKAGGYDSLTSTLAQIKNIAKRAPEDDKLLQQLVKCIKALTTHELGIHKILGDKAPLKIIRDLLFSSSINPKRRSFFVFEVSTRALMLDVLCTLASLQTQGQAIYVHGYDILQQLLLDTPEDLALQAQEDDEKPVNRVSHYPFPMTLKEAKEHETGDTEPNNSPRYSAWMRELAFTVDKSIEPITFLAQVLDYRFESAFKQLKIQPDVNNANWKQAVNEQIAKDPSANPVQAGGSVMVDEGVVDYLITHLRLMCTLITTPPTTYRGVWDPYSQEALRMELMESGFDKIARSLQSCPHPTLYSTYIKYLQPLLQPWAPSTVAPAELAGRDPPLSTANNIDANVTSVTDKESDTESISTETLGRNGAQAPIFGLSTSDETLWNEDDFYDMEEDEVNDDDSFFAENFDDVFYENDSDSFSEDSEGMGAPRPQARETWKTSSKRT